jgi:DNA-binding GntR family transcriptional regulator
MCCQDVSTEPLYEQIAAAVRAQIDAGEIAPHSPAPSERVLGDRFGVSRMTARAAVQALEEEGYVYRNGRRGTFVAEPRLELPIGSFTVDVTRAGRTPRAKLLEAKTCQASGQLQAALRLEAGEEVHQIRRLRFAGSEPIAIENTSIPQRLCPDLLEQDLEHSLWLLLEQRYGITVARAEAVIQAITPTPDQAALLAVHDGTPAIVLDRTVVDSTGRLIEFARDLYRADRASFRVGAQLSIHPPLR